MVAADPGARAVAGSLAGRTRAGPAVAVRGLAGAPAHVQLQRADLPVQLVQVRLQADVLASQAVLGRDRAGHRAVLTPDQETRAPREAASLVATSPTPHEPRPAAPRPTPHTGSQPPPMACLRRYRRQNQRWSLRHFPLYGDRVTQLMRVGLGSKPARGPRLQQEPPRVLSFFPSLQEPAVPGACLVDPAPVSPHPFTAARPGHRGAGLSALGGQESPQERKRAPPLQSLSLHGADVSPWRLS